MSFWLVQYNVSGMPGQMATVVQGHPFTWAKECRQQGVYVAILSFQKLTDEDVAVARAAGVILS